MWGSGAFILLSLVLIFTKGPNYGIDFTGGAEIQVALPANWDTGKLREALKAGGIAEDSVIKIEGSERNQYLIKTQVSEEKGENVGDEISRLLSSSLKPNEFEVEKVDVVGPKAGQELRSSAIISMLMAIVGILIYITFRFDVRFSPGIVRALIFDVISTMGVWIIMGREFNLSTVAALLTIAGYSCNDTVVIYDRIRDLRKMFPDMPLPEVVNKSVNINLGRTIITVLCTNIAVVSLWLLGGPVLGDFALVMLIGFTISIPSTIFVAAPMVIYMEERIQKQQQKKGGKMEASPKHA